MPAIGKLPPGAALDIITAARDYLIPIMLNDSSARIDRSIAELETLATFLADEVQRPWQTAVLPADRRLYKEALLTISVLLPKLQAVRRAHLHPPELQAPRCPNCED